MKKIISAIALIIILLPAAAQQKKKKFSAHIEFIQNRTIDVFNRGEGATKKDFISIGLSVGLKLI